MSVRILGIDPGSRVTGFGIIDVQGETLTHVAHGVIELDTKEQDFHGRLAELQQAIFELQEKYQARESVIEKIFLGKNADSAFKLGHARGVVIAELACSGCRIFEYATRSVKKGITGNGGSSKEDVQFVLKQLLGLKQVSRIDASDALAMAVYHARERQKSFILSRMKELL